MFTHLKALYHANRSEHHIRCWHASRRDGCLRLAEYHWSLSEYHRQRSVALLA